jgi:uncharacterized protein YggE
MTHSAGTATATLPLFSSVPGQASPSVKAQGSASIPVPPDQAQVTIAVSTDGLSAQDAGLKSGSLAASVLHVLQKVVGQRGDIQTVSYAVSPRYSPATAITPAVLVGYTATHTQQVTLTDLMLVGRVIDAAVQAGASSIGDLTLGLQDPEPWVQIALSAAAKQALANASAIASGLGGKTDAVISADQSSFYSPVPVPVAGVVNASIPIQTGPILVSATVTVTVGLQ